MVALADKFHHDITTTFKSIQRTSDPVESKLLWQIQGKVGLERNLIASLKRMGRPILKLSCQKEKKTAQYEEPPTSTQETAKTSDSKGSGFGGGEKDEKADRVAKYQGGFGR